MALTEMKNGAAPNSWISKGLLDAERERADMGLMEPDAGPESVLADYYHKMIDDNPTRDREAIIEGILAIHKGGRVPKELPNVDQVEALGKSRMGYDVVGGLATLGRGLARVPENWAAKMLDLGRDFNDISVVNPDKTEKYIQEINRGNRGLVQSAVDEYGGKSKLVPGLSVKDVAEATGSLGYSVAAMTGAVPAGVAGGLAGQALGSVAGPIGAAVGKVAGQAIGAGGASGLMSYRMASNDIMRSFLQVENDKKIEKTGFPLTIEEENKLKADFADKAREAGLAEAVTEGVGDAAFFGLIGMPLKKIVGTKTATAILEKLGIKAAAEKVVGNIVGRTGVKVAADVPPEVISEAAGNIWADRATAGTSVGPQTAPEWNAETFAKYTKDVAPQTILTVALMGGFGEPIHSTYEYIKTRSERQISREIQDRVAAGGLDEFPSDAITALKNVAEITAKKLPGDKGLTEAIGRINQEFTKRQEQLALDKIRESLNKGALPSGRPFGVREVKELMKKRPDLADKMTQIVEDVAGSNEAVNRAWLRSLPETPDMQFRFSREIQGGATLYETEYPESWQFSFETPEVEKPSPELAAPSIPQRDESLPEGEMSPSRGAESFKRKKYLESIADEAAVYQGMVEYLLAGQGPGKALKLDPQTNEVIGVTKAEGNPQWYKELYATMPGTTRALVRTAVDRFSKGKELTEKQATVIDVMRESVQKDIEAQKEYERKKQESAALDKQKEAIVRDMESMDDDYLEKTIDAFEQSANPPEWLDLAKKELARRKKTNAGEGLAGVEPVPEAPITPVAPAKPPRAQRARPERGPMGVEPVTAPAQGIHAEQFSVADIRRLTASSPKIKKAFADAGVVMPDKARDARAALDAVGPRLENESVDDYAGRIVAQVQGKGAKTKAKEETAGESEKDVSAEALSEYPELTNDWLESKYEEYGGKNKFLASDEYKSIYPKLQEKYKEGRENLVKEGQAATAEAGIGAGDKVYSFAQGITGGTEITGTVYFSDGIPRVKLDNPELIAGNKKSVRWHKGWIKIEKKESVNADKNAAGVSGEVSQGPTVEQTGPERGAGPGEAGPGRNVQEDERGGKEKEGEGAEKEGQTKEKNLVRASEVLSRWVQRQVGELNSFSWRELFAKADEYFGGTQAEGVYTPKDAYDAMELGVNRYLIERKDVYNPAVKTAEEAQKNIETLKRVTDKLPTQTKRTGEQQEFQQFSTPPGLSYAAAWVANMGTGDVVLEPSAGIGGLAVFGKTAGARAVIVNELSPRRAELLKILGFDRLFTENAEQINNILPADVKPTVVLMNPPFSATAGRVAGQRKTMNATMHIEQALKRLEPNGRLVAIVGRGMSDDSPTFKAWWAKIKADYNVRANVGISGKDYYKYGTSFDNQILVIDKAGKTDKIILGNVDSFEALPALLEEVRNDRPSIEQQAGPAKSASDQSGGIVSIGQGRGTARPERPSLPATGKPGDSKGAVDAGRVSDESAGTDIGDAGAVDVSAPREGGPVPGIARDASQAERDAARPGGQDTGRTGVQNEREGEGLSPSGDTSLDYGKASETASEAITDSVYDSYASTVSVSGAKPHPTRLVQSSAMAATTLPSPTYKPDLPFTSIKSGLLSDAQIEAIVYAGQAHSEELPDGTRRGFFIGDGTGVGKGREIAGIIMDNWRQGRKKAIWITEKKSLLNDAKRDLRGVGWKAGAESMFDLGKTKLGNEIGADKGILFATYDTLKKSYDRIRPDEPSTLENLEVRINQVAKWFGRDFDGVIVFDESHNMGNATATKGARGMKAPSQKALAGVMLQNLLPKARVVYVSATGATEVVNLSYAMRLGLWGEGTPFPNQNEFVNQISSGGISAMELISKDMKAMGAYMARSLSYKDVTFDRMEHKLTDPQREIYDELASAWQIVLQHINEALGLTEGEGTSQAMNAKGQFWGTHQRFFNQVITSMQMPSLIKAIEKDIAAGNSVILQLVNTGEAAQERALSRMTEGIEIEDLDMSPKDSLMDFINRSFPVQQYEKYTDENGNERSRPVVDSQGNPVLNHEAVQLREALLARLGSIRAPSGPLDIILHEFGDKNVAEVTGRHRRTIKDDDGRLKIQKWSKAKADADAQAFMNDEKKILVFSDAGGTGRSFHADMSEKNQRKRIHYLVQPGWRADKAIQGMGRSHRSNQKQAPHYVLVTTDLDGQKRFISSIARRLDQLGALTKGQRQTGSQGIFNARDNLESIYAQDALYAFFRDLARNRIEDLTVREFEEQTGLKLTDQNGSMNATLPEIRQFLNRLLSMNIEQQNKTFGEFSSRMDQIVQAHADAGTLDVGIETIHGLKVEKVSEQTVHADKRSGAETKYVQIDVTNPSRRLKFDDITSEEFYQNARSGKIWSASGARTMTNRQGEVISYKTLYSPGFTTQNVALSSLESDKWKTVKPADAKKLWSDEYDSLPETITVRHHIITGALLPIWDRIKGHPSILRLQTDQGERMLGREIKKDDLDKTLENLGVGKEKIERTGKELIDRILNQNYTIRLSNGWRLQRSMVSGDERVEIIGPRYEHQGLLQKQGAILETISYRTRYFIPTGESGNAILERVLTGIDIVSEQAPNARDQEADTLTPDGIVYSQGPVSRRPLPSSTVAQVEKWIGPQMRNISRRILRGGVNVVQSIQDIPDEILRNAVSSYQKQIGLTINGLYDPNTDGIYLIADHIGSKAEAMKVIAHELWGHKAIREKFAGPQVVDFFADVWDYVQAQAPNSDPAKLMKDVLSQRKYDISTEEGRMLASDEWWARAVDHEMYPDNLWKRFVSLFRAFLVKVGLGGEWARSLSDADIARIMRESREAVMRANGEESRAGGAGNIALATVHHGGPHVWKPEPGFPHGRPRLDMIGFGTGANTEGWGWYSAQAEGTGKSYQEGFETIAEEDLVDEVSNELYEKYNLVIQWDNDNKRWVVENEDGEIVSTKVLPKAAKELYEKILNTEKASFYKLDIPDDVLPKLLEWDKPLSEQSEYVNDRLWKISSALYRALSLYDQANFGEMALQGITRDLQKALKAPDSTSMTGNSLYSRLGDIKGDKWASEFLRDIGIPGNKYLDQFSRSEGKGTYNYVIWDQAVLDKIAVLERNGEKLDAIREAQDEREGAIIANAVTPSDDTAYMKAVESGDMEAAQRMVDEAAKKAGYNYHRYHQNKKGYSDVPWMLFAKNKEEVEAGYGKNHFVATGEGSVDANSLIPDIIDALEGTEFEDVTVEEIAPEDIVGSAGIWDSPDATQIIWDKVLENEGITTVKTPNGLVVFDPSQIKSADPVTYDDSGKVIPLSQRFNPQREDIRFSNRDSSLYNTIQYNTVDYSDIRKTLEAVKAIQEGKQQKQGQGQGQAEKAATGAKVKAQTQGEVLPASDAPLNAKNFFNKTGIQLPGGSEKDLYKAVRWIQTMQDLSHNYPNMKRLFDAEMARVSETNQRSVQDREITEPYFTLPKKSKLAVNKALLSGDQSSSTWDDDTLKENFKLDDTEIAGYRAMRKSLDDKLDILVGQMVEDVLYEGQAFDPNMVKAIKSTRDSAKMARNLEALGLDEKQIKKLGWIADWIVEHKGYVPHKWKSSWLVRVDKPVKNAKTGKVSTEEWMLEVPTIMGRAGATRFMRRQAAMGKAVEVVRKQFGWTTEQISALTAQGKIRLVKARDLPVELFQGARMDSIKSIVNSAVMKLLVEHGIAQAGQELDEKQIAEIAQTNEIAKGLLNQVEELYLAKGWGQHLIGRKGVKGYRENLEEILPEYLYGFNAFMSKGKAARDFANIMKDIDPRKTPEQWKHGREFIADMLGETSEAGWFKKIAGLYFLAGDLSAAALNATQNFTHGVAVLRSIKSRTKRTAEREIVKAMKDVAGDFKDSFKENRKVFSKPNQYISQAEIDAMREAYERGYLDPAFLGEVTGFHPNKVWMAYTQRGWDILFKLFTGQEAWNRTSTFLAAYRRSGGDVEFAIEATKDAHFVYGRGNRPQAIRKLGAVGNVAFTFMTYPLNNITFLKGWAEKSISRHYAGDKAGSRAAMKVIGSNLAYIFAFGGLLALPFGSGQMMMALSRAALNMFTGDDDDDAETAIRKHTPKMLGRGLVRGLPAALLGNDMSWRVEGTDILGMPIGFQIMQMGQRRGAAAYRMWNQGERLDAFFHLMPDMIRNPYRAVVGFREGGTRRDVPPIKYTPYEAVTKAFGFTPTRESEAYKASQLVRDKRTKRLEQVQTFAERFMRAKRSPDKARLLNELRADLRKYNKAEKAKGKAGVVIPFKTIVDSAKRRLKTQNTAYGDNIPKYMDRFQRNVESTYELGKK